jgi:hypothetical protein
LDWLLTRPFWQCFLEIDHAFHGQNMTMRRGLKPLVALAAVLPVLWISSCSRPQEAATAADPIAAGWSDYRMGEFDLGIAKFEAAIAANPAGSEEQLQALYGWGLSGTCGARARILKRPAAISSRSSTPTRSMTWPRGACSRWPG